MNKKLILLFLSLCLLLGVFAGCKKDKTTEPTDSTVDNDGGNTVDPILASLPSQSLGGREFRIMGQGLDGVFPKESQSDGLNQSWYQRTLFVEETFDCEIMLTNEDRPYDLISNDSLAGSASFDLVKSHPTEGIASLMTGGYCADLLTLNSFSFDSEWYNQTAIENYITNGKLYMTAADIAGGGGLTGYVFNRDLYKQLGYSEDLYDVVFAGDWTLEKFYDTIMSYNPDMDGVAESDRMYSLIYHKMQERVYMYGIDEVTVRRNSENEYELALSKEKLNTVADMLYKLVYQSDNVYVGKQTYYSGWGTSEMLNIFSSKHALFFQYDIGGLYIYLRELDFDIGYLPVPKYDTYQTEYRSVAGGCTWMIPATLQTKEDSALIFEAMARYGYLYVQPAFYETILQGRLSKNPDDYKMLELLYNSLVYDVGFTFDGAGTGVLKGILTQVVITEASTTVDSYLQRNSALLNMLVKQINTIQ